MGTYTYHMYLGLYSGGRILRRKFKLPGQTLDLDNRATNIKASLKMAMKELLISQPELEDGLISHSQNLFKLNNNIIQECNVQKTRLFKVATIVGLVTIGAALFYKYSS